MNVVPAKLGWKNGQDPISLRLYATDLGQSPRWDGPAGRVAEQALTENGGVEGDRFLIVRLGDRFIADEQIQELTEAIQSVVDSSSW